LYFYKQITDTGKDNSSKKVGKNADRQNKVNESGYTDLGGIQNQGKNSRQEIVAVNGDDGLQPAEQRLREVDGVKNGAAFDVRCSRCVFP
jgi:hypothetical protein